MKATDRYKLIDRVKTIEGLTDDERSELLGLLRESKTYGLVWEDKPENVEERLREDLPVLIEDKSRALTEAGPDAPNHILIEGDNLEALSTLAYTHAGKIDVIYIDPPYNTGNKDFIYNDSYVDKEDSYRHSKWLSFMSKRLRIAKKLMAYNAVIFISIDEHEYANLKLLCDEIFRENYCLGDIIRITTKRVKGDAKNINIIHDHILVYASSLDFQLQHKLKEDFSIYELEDEHVMTRGKYLIRPLDNGSISYSTKSDYIIIAPDGTQIVAGGDSAAREKRISGEANSKDWCFRWSEDKFKWGLENDFIVFKQTKNGWRCYFKIYQFVDNKLQPTVKFDNQTSLIDECYNNQGTTEIKNILPDNNIFTYPKPISLLKTLLALCTSKSTVLDFFAGSGTTLHATMQLNAEDGGKRTCILCTNNENRICETVTYERNKRVIEGYTKPNGEHVEGLLNNNLRYYRTDFVDRSRTVKNMRRLVHLSTDMLCIKENLYEEQKTFAGMPTFKNIYRYFEHGDKKMLVIYDERYVEEIVEMMEKVETDSKIKVYVFSPSEDPWEACFEPVNDKVELCALPQAIYNTYQRILPKRRPKPLENLSSQKEGGE
ncbi:MAG: site-specific DNA-methyltransferase [Muribaculaceae bacterium]|nr:site-specific DNA-methyltransferase [Muribaculaceae bacterium]